VSSKGRFAIGAVIGAVAGVIAGLLTAPKSGKESRADLKEKTEDLKRGATKNVNRARAKGEEIVESARARIDHKE
jgi:gas vesicle protein